MTGMPAMTEMTMDRVRALLAAYGADPGHWPEAERAAALCLAETDPGLASEMAEASALDGLLDVLPAPAPNPALRVRLKAIPDRAALRWADRLTAFWPFGAPWRPAAGLVAAALVGIVVGFATPEAVVSDGEWSEATITVAAYDPVAAVAAMASGAGVGTLEILQ